MVVTIIYLAIQIRGNTRVAKAQAMATWNDASSRERDSVYQNRELAELLVRIAVQQEQPEDLSDIYRFETWVRQFVNGFEILHMQYKQGVVDEDFLEPKAWAYTRIMSLPGIKSWWVERGRPGYETEFVAYVDGKLGLEAAD